jgi:hypothetical protein
MSARIFTVVRLPGGQGAGLAENGEVSAAEAIAAYRDYAASKLIEATEVLDAADEDFRVVVERGVHRVTLLKTLQEGQAA